MKKRRAAALPSLSVAAFGLLAAGAPAWAAGRAVADKGLPTGGLLVHFGSGTGTRTVGFAKPPRPGGSGAFVVHGLEKDARKVEQAQRLIRSSGLSGQVSVEHWTSPRLPYADNLVNLLIASGLSGTGTPSRKEIMRVLCPGGVAKIGSKTIRKPWPKEYDGWTHLRHGADGNPVSGDTAVSLPRSIRWVAPAARNRTPLLSANGRNFYGNVFVRDAFNGLPLWERRFTPRVAAGDLLYGIDGNSVAVLDAADGKPLGRFGAASRETSVLLVDDRLIVATQTEVRSHDARRGSARWAFRAKSPRCVVAGDGRLFFVDGNPKRGDACSAVCLDLATGKETWRSEPHSWLGKASGSSYSGGYLAYEVCSFSDEGAGNAIHLLSAKNGKHLWSHSYEPGMSHKKQARAFFLGKDLWIHCRGFRRVDLASGKEVKKIGGGGGHCYPATATVRFLLAGELNFTDVLTGKHERNAITKGECGSTSSGWTPANGLLYTYKGCRSHCICYPMIEGCLGLAPSGAAAGGLRAPASAGRHVGGALVKGPASGVTPPKTPKEQAALEWPCYRHDCWRSGSTPSPLEEKMGLLWAAPTGAKRDGRFAGEWKGNPFVMGPVTAPTVGGGTVFAGLPDAHRVVGLDAGTGRVRWTFTANGRIDTPPTYQDGLCLFGTRSGWVYCLLAADGKMVWRRRAGPEDRRIIAWGQLESAWPVPGSVLAYGGVVYVSAGRSALADGGIQVSALKARTGQALWQTAVMEYDIRGWYARVGWDYDPVDLMAFDGQKSLVLSRARIGFRGGKPQVKRGEGSYYQNRSGVWVPVGIWAYGTAINRGGQKRPLWVFKDRVLYGPPPHKGATRKDGGNVGSGLHAFELADKPPKTGGREWGPYQHLGSLRKKWSAKVGKIVAMVAADKTLFVADSDGRLLTFSAADGKKLRELKLPGPPVWDGMAAAYGRLYVSLADGRIVSLGNRSSRIKVPKPVATKPRLGM